MVMSYGFYKKGRGMLERRMDCKSENCMKDKYGYVWYDEMKFISSVKGFF